jgi:glucosamine kinase
MTSVVIGVDGGGTHTGIGFADGTVESLQSTRVDRPGRVVPGQEATAAKNLDLSIQEARNSTALQEPAAAIVFGLAGVGDEAVATALAKELKARLPDPVIKITTDAEIAFADAFPDGRGILLSAGTGSIAVGSTGDALVRVGGYGWRFGDDGSGYWIGRAALNAVQRANDGRGEGTVLTDRLKGVDVKSLTAPRNVALLTADVGQAASKGDAIALEILDQAAGLLAAHIEALQNRLGETLPIAFNGGVLNPKLDIRSRVIKELGRRGFADEPLDVTVDPVRGAVRLALVLATS